MEDKCVYVQLEFLGESDENISRLNMHVFI